DFAACSRKMKWIERQHAVIEPQMGCHLLERQAFVTNALAREQDIGIGSVELVQIVWLLSDDAIGRRVGRRVHVCTNKTTQIPHVEALGSEIAAHDAPWST